MNNVGSWLTRNKGRAALLGAVIVVLALSGRHWLPGTQGNAASRKGGGSATVSVEAGEAKRQDVPVNLEGLGNVQAYNTVTVTTRVDGELQKLGFVEGQLVHKGDLLAQIDPRPYQAALSQTQAAKAKDEAQIAGAKQDLDRYTMLAPQNLTSQQVLDTQKATVSALEAQLKGDQATIDNARTQLAYTTITSPIEGRTGIRKVDVGNIVHSGDTNGIVVVTQVQPITLIFTLPEDSLLQINKALGAGSVPVTAVSRDGATDLDRGTLQLVDNQIDQGTGTVRLKAVFPNKQSTLWPGQFVNARVLVRIDRNALTIPTPAVQRGPNGLFTYVVKADSTVEVRPISVGEDSGGITVVQNGLREGEKVVTTNQYRLEPGVEVKVVAPLPPKSEVASTRGTARTAQAPGNPP
jgi:membrane fusion protein, multidrug efflux system